VLRYKEKEDLESRHGEVDQLVERWREREARVSAELRREFRDKLIISLIYHDAALEGDVLSHGEIKAATDTNIISDASLIPSYEDIKNFYGACEHAFGSSGKRKPTKVESAREIYLLLDPEAQSIGAAYRKENPLHRLYYHDIAPPDKIPYRMRKFGEWLEHEAPALHPIERAADAHFRLMSIFPWSKHTGRTARILANCLLERFAYPLAVIHSIDRQRYYESLRGADARQLLAVYLEACETTAASAMRVYEEAERGRGRRAS
jgi:Fic family protein